MWRKMRPLKEQALVSSSQEVAGLQSSPLSPVSWTQAPTRFAFAVVFAEWRHLHLLLHFESAAS
jgi:hypothetical protein